MQTLNNNKLQLQPAMWSIQVGLMYENVISNDSTVI